MPQRIDDAVMPTLFSPQTGKFLDVTDHENDNVYRRIVFTEEYAMATIPATTRTYVYVIAVDGATGDWAMSFPEGFLAGYGTVTIDDSGYANDLETFPNGAEWCLNTNLACVYYSKRDPGRPTGIWFARESAPGSMTFSHADEVPFPAMFPPQNRFLVNCTYSELLEDRVLFYVRARVGTDWRRGKGCWCVHDDLANTLRPGLRGATEFDPYEISPDIRVRSAPARPIPDVYAVFMGETDETTGRLTLSWFELRMDRDQRDPRSSKVLRTYELSGDDGLAGTDDDVVLVGLGARRAPNHDVRFGPRAFVLYAVFSGPVDPRDPTRGRYSWYDSFLVHYDGALGGRIDGPQRVADARGAVTVVRETRMVPQPPDGFPTYKFVLDDENFSDANGEPMVALVMGSEDTDDRLESVVVVCPALGRGPGAENVPTVRVSAAPSTTTIRMDPEPMTLVDGSTVIFHQEDVPAGRAPEPVALPDFSGLEFPLELETRTLTLPSGDVEVVEPRHFEPHEPEYVIFEPELYHARHDRFRRARVPA